MDQVATPNNPLNPKTTRNKLARLNCHDGCQQRASVTSPLPTEHRRIAAGSMGIRPRTLCAENVVGCDSVVITLNANGAWDLRRHARYRLSQFTHALLQSIELLHFTIGECPVKDGEVIQVADIGGA